MADLTEMPWSEMNRDLGARDRVAKNFCVYELTRSEIAERQGIDNWFPNVTALRAAVYLCRNIMQPVRDKFGRYSPNSVYRCQALERALKKQKASWRSTSQHTRGQACDIEIPGLANMKLAAWVRDNLEFDQLILECFNAADGPNSGWVHVSLRPPGQGGNRGDVKSYVRPPGGGRFEYVPGLCETP